MNKNKMVGVFQVDNKHYQLDFYGVKKYEGVNEEDGMPIYMKKVPLKVNRCMISIPRPTEDEIENSKILKHPFLINLLKVFQDDSHIHLVSERGVTNLLNIINQIHSDQKIFSTLLDLLIGVCFIRSKGYLHCNFVASNIQICESNIKIGGLDACFPEHKALEEIKKGQKLNFKQMCPQILKQEQFSEKGLIWNFGVIVYQMIFKKLPFEGQRKQQVLPKMLNGVNFSSTIHPLFSIILMGCLRPNPLCRFSLNQLLRCILSSNELSSEFEQILGKKIGALQAAYTLPESEWMFQKFTIIIQIMCELDFVRFLERFCFLLSKIERNNDTPPILSLTQFIIKCRLYKLQRHQYWHRNNYCHKIEFDKRELIKNHVGTNTNGQQSVMNNPDYKLFRLSEHSHKQITYLHYQHFLRQFIQKQSKQLYRYQQSEIEYKKYEIYSIDFAISLFLINEDMIQQGQQHKWNALDNEQINQLSQNALQPNIRAVYQDVVQKAKNMGFI